MERGESGLSGGSRSVAGVAVREELGWWLLEERREVYGRRLGNELGEVRK